MKMSAFGCAFTASTVLQSEQNLSAVQLLRFHEIPCIQCDNADRRACQPQELRSPLCRKKPSESHWTPAAPRTQRRASLALHACKLVFSGVQSILPGATHESSNGAVPHAWQQQLTDQLTWLRTTNEVEVEHTLHRTHLPIEKNCLRILAEKLAEFHVAAAAHPPARTDPRCFKRLSSTSSARFALSQIAIETAEPAVGTGSHRLTAICHRSKRRVAMPDYYYTI